MRSNPLPPRSRRRRKGQNKISVEFYLELSSTIFLLCALEGDEACRLHFEEKAERQPCGSPASIFHFNVESSLMQHHRSKVAPVTPIRIDSREVVVEEGFAGIS
jgi:hypothetical protein